MDQPTIELNDTDLHLKALHERYTRISDKVKSEYIDQYNRLVRIGYQVGTPPTPEAVELYKEIT